MMQELKMAEIICREIFTKLDNYNEDDEYELSKKIFHIFKNKGLKHKLVMPTLKEYWSGENVLEFDSERFEKE
jgi:hypothetical protein